MPTPLPLTKPRAPRPTFSCQPCQRKKRRCDHGRPCGQCARMGRGRGCVYDEADDGLPAPSPRRGDFTPAPYALGESVEGGREAGAIGELQERVRELERRLADGIGGGGGKIEGEDERAERNGEMKGRGEGRQRRGDFVERKGDSTRFRSRLSWKALAPEFHDVQAYIARLNTPPAAALRRDLLALQREFPKRPSISLPPPSPLDSASLRALLPPRAVCEPLADIYLATVEAWFPLFVHVDILAAVDRGWDLPPGSEKDEDDALWLQYAAIVALGGTLSTAPPSPLSFSPSTLISAVSARLAHTRGKRRLRLSILRAHLLVLLHRLLETARADEVWLEAGGLVHLAVAMGLHRDPGELAAHVFTPGEAEQRRQAWAAVMEVCLQLAMGAGMPVLLPTASTRPPQQGGILLGSTLEARIVVWNALVDDSSTTPASLESTVADLYARLHAHLNTQNAPKGDPQLTAFARAGETQLFARTLAHAYLAAVLDNDDDVAAARLCELSLGVLRAQDPWDPALGHREGEGEGKGEGMVEETAPLWAAYHALFREDVVRAAVCLCVHFRRVRGRSPPAPPAAVAAVAAEPVLEPSWFSSAAPTPPPPHEGSEGEEGEIARAVERALDALGRRATAAGKDAKAVVCLSVVLAFSRGVGDGQGEGEGQGGSWREKGRDRDEVEMQVVDGVVREVVARLRGRLRGLRDGEGQGGEGVGGGGGVGADMGGDGERATLAGADALFNSGAEAGLFHGGETDFPTAVLDDDVGMLDFALDGVDDWFAGMSE